MSLLDAFALEPFTVNEQLVDSLLLEPDQFEFWIASTTSPPGNPGSGTQGDPYDGSTQTLFDALMNSFPPNTTIHLGPGDFQTNGSGSGGWAPKSGQRIVGAGVDETILKLVNASSSSTLTAAIGTSAPSFLNGFEMSDLTVDCNLSAQSPTAVACAAVSVSGSHIYIARVRVINFGTQTTSVKGAAILVGNADPSTPQVFDCVVEDCVIEQPSPNNVRETTCIGIGTKEDANGAMAYHRACVIRNCYIDCAYTNDPLAISSITYLTTTATVTTTLPHGLQSGQYWMVVTGALENGVLSTNYNGSFLVTITTATQFTYTMPGTPTYLPTGEMYIRRAPSQRVAVKTLTFAGGIATLETFTPHNRFPGQKVVVNNVAGMTPTINGSFAINDLGSPAASPFIIRFNYSGTGTPDYTSGYVGPDFRAIEADGGIGTIIENNRIYNCTFGCYHDSYSSKDMVIRHNHFRGVNTAIYQKMGGGGNPVLPGYSLTHSGTTATFTTPVPHGSSAGQGVIVGGATPSDYNGIFAVASVPSPTSFTYVMSTTPGTDATGRFLFGALRLGSSLTRNGALAIFSTSQPHGLSVGQIVAITGASPSGYNGTFQVASVPTPTSFTYALVTDPGSNASGSPVCNGSIAAVSLVRSKTLATLTSSLPHGLSFGQAVVVSGASPSTYNGTFPVASVPSPTSFTYIMSSDPGVNASGTFGFGALWRVGRLIIQKNVIELILNVIASGWEAPVAVCLYDSVGSHGSQYVFQQVIIRGNVIRHVDNASDTSQMPLGIYLDSCLNAIIENNDINLDNPYPVRHYTIGTAKYFNNQMPAGKLIQGASCAKSGSYSVPIYAGDTFNQSINELTTDADLGLSLTI